MCEQGRLASWVELGISSQVRVCRGVQENLASEDLKMTSPDTISRSKFRRDKSRHGCSCCICLSQTCLSRCTSVGHRVPAPLGLCKSTVRWSCSRIHPRTGARICWALLPFHPLPRSASLSDISCGKQLPNVKQLQLLLAL